VAALALCALAAAPALADPKNKPKKPPIPLRVMVTRLSNEGRGIDPGARDLENKLSNQGIRYDSAQVLEKKRMQLQMNEDGVLMAVDVDGGSKADVRAKPNHTVIFSAGPYEDGKLVLSVEPEQAPEP
jgi:hypothetical protein